MKKKSQADWTNWRILEQVSREEKKTKPTVSSLLIKSLQSNLFDIGQLDVRLHLAFFWQHVYLLNFF